MSRARGCEPRRRAAPQAHENAGIHGYRERAACAPLTRVVLWRRRLVDAETLAVTTWIADMAGAISLCADWSSWLWSRRSRVRVPSLTLTKLLHRTCFCVSVTSAPLSASYQ